MSDAAYYREYRKTPQFKAWSVIHESKPERVAARSAAREKYREANRTKIAESTRMTRDERREECHAIKDVPCADCGAGFPVCCMDFDHRPGTDKHPRLMHRTGDYKVAPISMTALAMSDIEAFREEVKKCDVVCSNCHRIRTAERIYHKLDEAKS